MALELMPPPQRNYSPRMRTTRTICRSGGQSADRAPRPVRTITVERAVDAEAVSLTGHIRAQDEVSLAFRLGGRMLERPVNVGDLVKPGQLVAKLDPKDQQDALHTAQANLAAAEALLTQARLTFGASTGAAEGWLDTPRQIRRSRASPF
jgi:membrane fusion protein, multidrug efflux system